MSEASSTMIQRLRHLAKLCHDAANRIEKLEREKRDLKQLLQKSGSNKIIPTIPLPEPEPPTKPKALIRKREVIELLGGVSQTTLWRWYHDGDFPKPIQLGTYPYWHYSEVIEWIRSRPRL